MIFMMQRIDDKNRFFTIVFNILKSIMFDIIMKTFIKNIIDSNVKKKTIKKLTTIDRFLKITYNFAKKIKRIKLEIKKQMNEKFKIKELKFYKTLTQKFMFLIQLKSFMIFYQFRLQNI